MNFILTRLLPASTSLTAQLESWGQRVFHEPLLEVLPLSSPQPPFLRDTVLALTSRTTLAIMREHQEVFQNLLNRPCFCVGDKTAEDAHAFGFNAVFSAKGDGLDLARLILEKTEANQPVLHLGGASVNTDFHTLLQQAGRQTHHWALYKTEQAPHACERFSTLFQENKIDAIVFYSTRAAQNYVRIIQTLDLQKNCRTLTSFSLSPAIQDALAPLPFAQNKTARKPNEDSLAAVIQSTYKF